VRERLALQPAVLTQEIPVVGGEDDVGVVELAGAPQRRNDPPDLTIDAGLRLGSLPVDPPCRVACLLGELRTVTDEGRLTPIARLAGGVGQSARRAVEVTDRPRVACRRPHPLVRGLLWPAVVRCRERDV